MESGKSESRRNFFRTTGIAAIGLTTISTSCVKTRDESLQENSSGELFLNEISGLTDRINRVKIATLGMQRYDWEQGTVAQAFLEMGELNLAVSFARGAILRQENGRFSVLKGNGPITDCASVGEVVLFAAKYTNDPVFQQGADEMLEVIKNTTYKTDEGIIYHTQEPSKGIWSDANYMLPPFLAAAGEYHEAIKQIEGFRQYLYNEKDKLYSHMWDDSKKEFARKDYWGVGNGWSAAGLTRVINMLPETYSTEKQKLVSYVKDIIDGCLKYMRPDGLFHDVVNNPDTFPEVNLSQMLCYSIYCGVGRGYLDKDYLDKAEIMRKAANERVDKLGYVHDVCGLPYFNRSYFAPEAQAFYLLMETAADDYYNNERK
ncbi:MAG: glycoside hydrolase family 88 protein [Prolixibacteraceae bacterium]|nr:glycoside hydrolase family 88 protein [Prolixibacteraceae bacterium]MBN2774536.1 glycoside hydrolase family 88 protein [Prolixibacteraceae bacterium]